MRSIKDVVKETGQGTVEYIGLLLLLAGVFAAVAAGKGNVGSTLAKKITTEITEAVETVAP